MFPDIGKIVVVIGLGMVLVGLLIMTADKTGIHSALNWFGHLPLDIKIERENFKFYFPIGSSIVLSIILSTLLYLFNKFMR